MLDAVLREITFRAFRPRRLLFDHLPKCGGTTTSHHLAAHYPRRLVFQIDGEEPLASVKYFMSLPETQRHQFRLICGHVAHKLMDYVHPERLVLTIVREPIDRIVSQFYFVRQNVNHPLHEQVVKSNVQLEEYIVSGPGHRLRNFYTAHFSRLSLEEVDAKPEEALRLAIANLRDNYDVIGFQDDLGGAMSELKAKANLRLPFRGEVRNKTLVRPEVSRLSAPLRQVIAQVNHLDVRLYAMLKAGEANKTKASG